MVYEVFGYKVFKETDVPFGYDKVDGNLVVNPVEAEIVKYTFEAELETKNKKDMLPESWIEYLKQKTEECENIVKSLVNMENIKIPEWVRICDYTPIVDESTWEKVQGKLKEKSGMEMNL